MSDRRDEILDVAEALMRRSGFNAFSTRDVAAAVGIKAASVHYHFPTKADLGVAVTERYTDRFIEALGDPNRFEDARPALAVYVDSFRRALVRDRTLCLCAVLGAEIGGLPPELGQHTRVFFERNIEWLTQALITSSGLSSARAKADATHILAALEGALLISLTLGDRSVFESVGNRLTSLQATTAGTAETSSPDESAA
jgi:TetR/AcrR family transcriptional repressor of nem operon